MNAPVRLRVESGPERGRAVEIATPVLTIGRQDGNDIVFDDPRVSRRHLRIEINAGIPYLTDLGSSNGTFVNGQRVEGVRALHSDDIVSLGESRLRVEIGAPDVTASSGPPMPAAQFLDGPRLVLQNGAKAGAAFPLDRGVLTAGRHATNNIVLEDRQASRHHARFYLREGTVSISDLGSSHGTRVNGELVHGSVSLRAGDMVQIGTSLLKLEAPDPVAERHPARASATAAYAVGPPAARVEPDLPGGVQPDQHPATAPPPWSAPGAFGAAAPATGAQYVPASVSIATPVRGTRRRLIALVAAAALVTFICGAAAIGAYLLRQRTAASTPAAAGAPPTAPVVVGSPPIVLPPGGGGSNPAPPPPGSAPSPGGRRAPTPAGAKARDQMQVVLPSTAVTHLPRNVQSSRRGLSAISYCNAAWNRTVWVY